jgi:hypothetical protein
LSSEESAGEVLVLVLVLVKKVMSQVMTLAPGAIEVERYGRKEERLAVV